MTARGRLNLALLALLVALLLTGAMAKRDTSVPNVEFLPEMVRTSRWNAYSANPFFADGKTLQSPAPGTIPRGKIPLPYAKTEADATRAGRELRNPFAATDAVALARGAVVYQNFCLPCHGATGAGDGPVVRRGYPAPTRSEVPLSDGEMFHVITYGRGNMASYAAQVSREDRWRAILFIRAQEQKVRETAAKAGGPQ